MTGQSNIEVPTIVNPSDLLLFTEKQLNIVKEFEIKGQLPFYIPEKYKSNKEKTVYKCGFLVDVLKILYPERAMKDIYQMINIRYQVFLSRRQIERNYKEFTTNKFYTNKGG